MPSPDRSTSHGPVALRASSTISGSETTAVVRSATTPPPSNVSSTHSRSHPTLSPSLPKLPPKVSSSNGHSCHPSGEQTLPHHLPLPNLHQTHQLQTQQLHRRLIPATLRSIHGDGSCATPTRPSSPIPSRPRTTIRVSKASKKCYGAKASVPHLPPSSMTKLCRAKKAS